MIIESIEKLIGNTPLLLIPESIHGVPNVELYAKLEFMNPFGSLKDRVALGMLQPVLGELKGSKKTVLEASSGNTAKALCALAGIHGLKFKSVTNRIKTPEIRLLLQAMGAEIEELPGLSDCPDPTDPNDFTAVATKLATERPSEYHYTDQYFNPENLRAHATTTGQEILRDLGRIDHYFGFLGTCGSAMGIGQCLREQCLREHHSQTSVWGVVAAAGHHVPGGRNINELWEVGFFKESFFSGLLEGTREEAIDGMLTLNRKLGMLCGPTSGLCYHAAVRKLIELRKQDPSPKPLKAVFIACDRIESYTSYLKQYAPQIFASSTHSRPRVSNLDREQLLASKEITSSELLTRLSASDGGPKPLVIDIRGHFAYARGHIDSSINILDELFTFVIEEGPAFPMDRTIVVVCAVGTISRKFAAFLSAQGFDACSLTGGIGDWKKKGHSLETCAHGQ